MIFDQRLLRRNIWFLRLFFFSSLFHLLLETTKRRCYIKARFENERQKPDHETPKQHHNWGKRETYIRETDTLILWYTCRPSKPKRMVEANARFHPSNIDHEHERSSKLRTKGKWGNNKHPIKDKRRPLMGQNQTQDCAKTMGQKKRKSSACKKIFPNGNVNLITAHFYE